MKNSLLVAPDKVLGYTDIYIDFVNGVKPASSFYMSHSLEAVANEIDARVYKRDKLIEILIEQNKNYNAPAETFATIEKLRDSKSVCVFTGQQAGLFGGPMLTMIKAISIAKAARLYEKQLNRPVIPIFWIAADDHDLAEVNHTAFLDRNGELHTISSEEKPPHAPPIAHVRFKDQNNLNNIHAELQDILGKTDFTDELYAVLSDSYKLEHTYSDAFGSFMARFAGHLGLVFFSPSDPKAKKLAVSLFHEIIEKQDELHGILSSRASAIKESGYHIQVEKHEQATHLFYTEKSRLPILKESANFTTGEKMFTKNELLSEIEAYPEKFSPDVLTRPILQSFLFPTLSQKGGPSEIAYLAQINPIFELFKLPTPYYKARSTVTLVEKRFEQLMEKEEIEFPELLGDIEIVVNRVLAKTFPTDLEEDFKRFRRHLQTHFEDFTSNSLAFDPSLKKFAEQTYGKMDYSIKAFEGKVFSAHKKKSQETRERIYKMHRALAPNRNFQERTLNISYFISKYGREIIDFIFDKMDSEESAHQLLCLSEMEN